MKTSIFGIIALKKMKIIAYYIFYGWYLTMDSEDLNFIIMKGEWN